MKKLNYEDENPALNKSNLPDMMIEITKNLVDAEEKVIKAVLCQILEREPTLEDAKDLQRIRKEGEFDKYCLAYKNLTLGTVYINTNIEGGKMGVKFVPFENERFLRQLTSQNMYKVAKLQTWKRYFYNSRS